MSTLQDLGITREDILDRVAEKLIESLEDDWTSFAEKVKARVVDDVKKQSQPKIDQILDESLKGLVDAPFTPIDEYGEPTRKKATTLRQMIKDRAMNYMTERVDNDGRPNSYNSTATRGEWMAKKAANEAMTYEIKAELKKSVDTAKDHLRQQVANYIKDTLLK